LRCNGTGTVYINDEERRCPGCTEKYTTAEEVTKTGTESWVKNDYDLTGYPEPVQRLVEEADSEVQSRTKRPAAQTHPTSPSQAAK
jgi:transcriptional regulator NrdR family protein